MKRNSPIQESVRQAAPLRVDREKGIIYGVKLLGERSANPPPNDHEYPRATREAAVGLLEGLGVFVDHGPRQQGADPRSYRDRMGCTKNVTERGDGLYGDWHFPPEHSLASSVCWDAENAPGNLGFSINGAGDKNRSGDRTIVEAITELASVDLVTRPATTGGLFEGRRMATEKQFAVKDLIESLKTKRPGFSRALKEMAESGITTGDAMMDAPPEEAPADMDADADHEATFVQGIKDAIGQVLDDDGMSWDDKMKKVMEYLKTAKKHVEGKGGGDDDGGPDGGPGDATEEGRRRAAAGASALRESALAQLAGKGATLTPTLLLAVNGCRTEADVKSLVESQPAPQAQRPGARSAAPGGGQTARIAEGRQQQAAADQDTPEARRKRVSAARTQR